MYIVHAYFSALFNEIGIVNFSSVILFIQFQRILGTTVVQERRRPLAAQVYVENAGTRGEQMPQNVIERIIS